MELDVEILTLKGRYVSQLSAHAAWRSLTDLAGWLVEPPDGESRPSPALSIPHTHSTRSPFHPFIGHVRLFGAPAVQLDHYTPEVCRMESCYRARVAPAALTVALAFALAAPAAASAQSAPRAQRSALLPSVDPALFKGLRYRMVGPNRGGRVTAVTGVPSQPFIFYMGVASGGVWKTTDAGQNWFPISDGKIPLGSIGAIEVSQSDPNIVYVGTGSDGVRSNVSIGRGVYKSTDAGQTWTFVGLRDVGQIGAVRVHPTNPDVVFLSATGNPFAPNAERGIFKTTDGGRTWRKILYVSDSTGGADVELQPGNPDVVFAVMSRLERKPWTIISGAREGGIYKSIDAGEHWTRLTSGLPIELIGKGNIAVTAANPNRLYLLYEAKPGGGLYRSDDAGATWTLVSAQPS